jgi:choline dehydrogenase-like flavoprotein
MKEIFEEICIVGSGMGGGTLAISLAQSGVRPLIVEIGSEHQSKPQKIQESGRPFALQATHALELGGGSNLWHGVVAPLDKCDFEGVFENNLPKWPISYEEMIPYWSKALNFLGFTDEGLQNVADYKGVNPLINEIDFNSTIFKPKLFRVLTQPTRLKKRLLEHISNGSIKVMKNTVVKSINFSNDGKAVESVLVHAVNGDILIKAEKFIVCAGALNTPKIFLNSDLSYLNQEVTKNIGKYLSDHPMGFLGKIIFKKKTKASLFSDVNLNKSERIRVGLTPVRYEDFGNTNMYIRPSLRRPNSAESDKLIISLIAVRSWRDLKLKQITQMLINFGTLFRLLINKFPIPISYRAADLFFVMDQSPTIDSCIKLSNLRDEYGMRKIIVNWSIADYDLKKINMLLEVSKSFFGAKSIDYQIEPNYNDWINIYTSAAHHLGTMRMSRSYEDGVVDSNLAFQGVHNLWICDGSVVPSGGNANPSLTICALAMRLSEHLLKNSKEK